MKKILLNISILFGIIAISCNQTESIETGQGHNYRTLHNYIQTNFSNEQYPLTYLNSGNSLIENFNINKEMESQQAILEKEVFNLLLTNFSSFYDVDFSSYLVRGVVFYGNDVSIDLNEFNNFTLIISDNEGFYKFLSYNVNGNSLTLIDDDSQKHSFIMLNYFGFLGHQLNSSNNSLLVVFNSDTLDIEVSQTLKDNIKPENLELTALNEYSVIPYSYRGGHFCDECEANSRGFCAWNDGDKGIICNPSSYVEDNECADDEQTIKDANARIAMYTIRDNFLLPTTKGKEYVDYYYKISYAFKIMGIYEQERENLENLFIFIRSKALNFIASGSGTIMINNTEYSYLENMIQEYKEFSNNQEYKFIFDKMSEDLSYIRNKSKADIINYLQ